MSFAKRGSIVSENSISRMERMLQNHKGGKVTMGSGVPRQRDGAVGDITVRKLADGLRCYIKTDSGWYDINNMTNDKPLEWFPMNLNPSGSNWSHNTIGGMPSYAKDRDGFVHFRGALAKGDSTITETITVLPDAFRPFFGNIMTPVVASTIVTAYLYISQSNGVVKLTGAVGVSGLSPGSAATATWLDGVSFFAGDTETGIIGSSAGAGGASGGGGGY